MADADVTRDGEEDARSEESFQSADDDDDFDLPQDLGGFTNEPGEAAMQAAPTQGSSAGPPGFDEGDGGDGEGERWNLKKDGNKEQLEPIWLRLSGEQRHHVKISKMFSYVLRHAAHKLDVRIRKDGFVRLREIMKLKNFKQFNLEELMAVVYFDEKERYTMVREFDGELLIRANQGHTMKVVEDDLLLEPIVDSTTVQDCVHGTYLVHWPFIKRQGLSKVARNHIHLANGLPEDGKIRGMRSTAELFVYVDVPRAMEDGVIFYRSKNEVILTQGMDGWLPPKYFQKAVRIDYNTCDVEELEYDIGADMPMWAAELAPSGPGEQGTYLIKNLEALISNCKKRLHEINELKALMETGQELNEEDTDKITKHAQVYTELLSLEQRFRQHKGHRKESSQEKENRAKEEAEAETVVKRKDRAVTPPWEKGKSHMESSSMKATEKEKAEWAALGRRRDSAPTPQAKKDDEWSRLGRGRAHTAKDDVRSAFKNSKSLSGLDRGEETWRFRGDDDRAPALGRANTERFASAGQEKLATPSGAGGPPRFFNSKKDVAGSWRSKMAGGHSTGALDDRDGRDGSSARKDSDDGSWRDQMGSVPSGSRRSAHDEHEASARASPSMGAPTASAQAHGGAGMSAHMGASASDGAVGQYMQPMQMWQQGAQMCGYDGQQGQMYFMQSPQHGQGGAMQGTPSWQGQGGMMMRSPQHQQSSQMANQMSGQMQQPQRMQPQMSPTGAAGRMQTQPMQGPMSPQHSQQQQQMPMQHMMSQQQQQQQQQMSPQQMQQQQQQQQQMQLQMQMQMQQQMSQQHQQQAQQLPPQVVQQMMASQMRPGAAQFTPQEQQHGGSSMRPGAAQFMPQQQQQQQQQEQGFQGQGYGGGSQGGCGGGVSACGRNSGVSREGSGYGFGDGMGEYWHQGGGDEYWQQDPNGGCYGAYGEGGGADRFGFQGGHDGGRKGGGRFSSGAGKGDFGGGKGDTGGKGDFGGGKGDFGGSRGSKGGAGKDKSGKNGEGKGGKRGSFGKDRGGDDNQDWAALGRARAAV